MKAAIVIPCLNEARLIGRTARSLGFGAKPVVVPTETLLILVDNGSTDETWAALEAIRDQSAPSTVLLAREPERGYVPPRNCGVIRAAEYATDRGLSLDDLIVLQADGDTVYEPGFTTSMCASLAAAGPNHLVEGNARPPYRFLSDHPGFQALADQVDEDCGLLGVPDESDVIVDDKVAGYRLSDYLRWGGLRRDYSSAGIEIHAETSRLYIRALQQGARKVRASEAYAQPSRRKIQRNPIRHFATAGFPRDEAWWRSWSVRHPTPRDLAAFDDPLRRHELAPAIATRRAHVRALFGAAPRVVWGLVDPQLARTFSPLPDFDDLAVASAAIADDDLGRFFEVILPSDE